MATQAYYDWVADGKPSKLATPVREYRDAFRTAGWPALSIGTLGDVPHLQAAMPLDHTPFSVTGWPNVNPYPYVHAIDVSHQVSRETELDSIVAHWVAGARAGETPWVKYIIYKETSWSVRNGWTAVPATGHNDHAHVSMRTDHTTTSIGTYNPLGRQNMAAIEHWIDEMRWRIYDVFVEMRETSGSDPTNPAPNQPLELPRAIHRIEAKLGALSPSLTGAQLDQIAVRAAETLAADGDFVDTIASAVAARVGMIPTAGEIARAIGELRFQVRAD